MFRPSAKVGEEKYFLVVSLEQGKQKGPAQRIQIQGPQTHQPKRDFPGLYSSNWEMKC